MNFYQLATKNVLRNLRSYFAFYLSSSFAVMTFYMFAMFIFHPAIEGSYIGREARFSMVTAEWTIYLFSIFFIFYSVHAFMRTRRKELGTLLIMGISPRHLKHLLTTENMVIGTGSIVTGIIGGTIFTQMFFAAGAYMFKMQDPLTIYLPWKAMGLTAGVFLPLFFVISRVLLFFTRTEKAVALLQGSVKSRRDPKSSLVPSLVLSLVAIAVLHVGFGIAILAAVSILLGTYLLFSQLSVWLLHLLKKNKNIYLKGVNLLTTSDLINRVKDNASLFCIVTFISTVAFVTTGLLSADHSARNEEPSVFETEYVSLPDNEKEAEHLALIESALQDGGFDYRLSKVAIISATVDPYGFDQLFITSDRELSKHLPSINLPSLNNNEGVIYPAYPDAFWGVLFWDEQIPEVLSIYDSSRSITVEEVKKDPLFSADLLVVNEQTFHQLSTELGPSTLYGFNYENWKDSFDVDESVRFMLGIDDLEYNDWYYSKAFNYFITSQLPGLHLFIGLFVVIVFYFAAGSFLYFRLFTDLQEEREKYKVLFKIGLTEREMRKSASFQLAVLFFLPFFVAVVHTVCIMSGDLQYSIGPTVGTISGFMVVQLICFAIARQMYLKNMTELSDE